MLYDKGHVTLGAGKKLYTEYGDPGYGSKCSFILADTDAEMEKGSNNITCLLNGSITVSGVITLKSSTYSEEEDYTGSYFHSGDPNASFKAREVQKGEQHYLELLSGTAHTASNSVTFCGDSSVKTTMAVYGEYTEDDSSKSGAIGIWTETFVSPGSFFLILSHGADMAPVLVAKNTSEEQSDLYFEYNYVAFLEGYSIKMRSSDGGEQWINVRASGDLEPSEDYMIVEGNKVNIQMLSESQSFTEYRSMQSQYLTEIEGYTDTHPEIAAEYTGYILAAWYNLANPSKSKTDLTDIIEEFREEVGPSEYIIQAGESITVDDIVFSAISKDARVVSVEDVLHAFVISGGAISINGKKYANAATADLDLTVDSQKNVALFNGTVTAFADIYINNSKYTPGTTGATLDKQQNLTSGSVIVGNGITLIVSGNTLTSETESEISFGKIPTLVSGKVNLKPTSSVLFGTIQISAVSGTSVSVSSDSTLTLDRGTQISLSYGSTVVSCKNGSVTPITTDSIEQLISDISDFDACKKSGAERALEYHKAGESEEISDLIDASAEKISALIYDVSISKDENEAAVQKMLQELVVAIGVDSEFFFNDERDALIQKIDALHSPGESSEVRTYLNDTVSSLSAMIYDHSLSLDDNLARLAEFDYDAVVEYIYNLNRGEFVLYVEKVDALIVAEEPNCDCYGELQVVKDYHLMVTTLEYDREQSIKYNTDQVDLLYTTFQEKISEYRPSSASFDIHLKNAVEHVEGTDDMGLKEIRTLISDYSGKLKAISFDKTATLDKNLSRIDSIVDSFDSQYTKAAGDAVNNHRDSVLNTMKTELANAKNDDMREIANRYIDTLSKFRYDSTISYTDNIVYIDNLNEMMKKELRQIENNLSSRFDGYKKAYIASFEERISVTENPDAIAILQNGIAEVRSMKYDDSLTLDQNRLRLDSLACDVQKRLKELESDVVEAQFEEYRQKALTYVSSKVLDGGNSSTDECIEKYKAEILAVQYDKNKTPEENQKAITGILERYDSEIGTIASQSLFDSAKSQLSAYLESELGSYPEIRSKLDESCAKIKSAKYDDTKTEDENIEALRQTAVGLIEDMDKVLKESWNEESAAYLKEAARKIDSYRGTGDSEKITEIIDEYVLKISETEIDGKSLLYNKKTIDAIVDGFIDAYSKQIESENADEFGKHVSSVKTAIGQKHTSGESSQVKTAIDKAYDRAGSLTFDPSMTMEDNKRLADSVLSELEYDLSVLNMAGEPEFRNAVKTFVTKGEETISGFDVELKIRLTKILTDMETSAEGTGSLVERKDAFISSKDSFNSGVKIQDSIDSFNRLRNTYVSEAEYEHMVNESSAVKIIINSFIRSAEDLEYNLDSTEEDNINHLDDLRSSFLTDLRDQRIKENALVVGDLNNDRKSTSGGQPEYPEGCTDIWGTVSNEDGMPKVSVTISRSDEGFSSNLNKCMNTGRFYVLTGDGKMPSVNSMDALCSFDVTLKEGTKTFSSFNGTYEVSILLPSDLRAYEKFQVVCFDQYGDMQVLDCRIEGNFLIFTTTHFSEFSLIGITIGPGSLTMEEALIITLAFAAVLCACLLCLVRSVRYDANGGEGEMGASLFLHKTRSRLDTCAFVKEGYRFAGWTDDSGAFYEDHSPIDSIGKFRHITLHAVWEANE